MDPLQDHQDRSRQPAGAGWLGGPAAAALAFAIPAGIAFLPGWADWRAVPAGGWLFVAAMAMATGVEAAASGTIRPTPAPAASRPDRTAIVLAGLTGLVLLAMSVTALISAPASRAPAAIVAGSALVAAGAWLRVAAIRRLGVRFRSDNAAPEDPAPEQGGPYRRLAHPSEVGLLALAARGLCLVPTPPMAELVAGLVAIQAWRLYLEEKSLFTRYGDVYLEYRRRTFDPLPSVFLFVGGRRK